MQNAWLYIGLFLIIGIIVPVAPLLISWLVAPKKPNPIKQSTYECGIETVGDSWVQFKAQYYIFALVFLVFDVETVFLFPWALAIKITTLCGIGRHPVYPHPCRRAGLCLAQRDVGMDVSATIQL